MWGYILPPSPHPFQSIRVYSYLLMRLVVLNFNFDFLRGSTTVKERVIMYF